MNLYFLVEGKTEKKVYAEWVKHLIPELTLAKSLNNVQQNNYYLFNGGGYPKLLDEFLSEAVSEINQMGRFDYLVIVLDADEVTVEERVQEVLAQFTTDKLHLERCQLQVIVQNKCFESWFLGNRVAFIRQPQASFLRDCINFYNVAQDDPERMYKPAAFIESASKFHFTYLRAMLAERNVFYSKRIPAGVVDATYLSQIERRVDKLPEQLHSFQVFRDFCREIRKQILEGDNGDSGEQ